MPVFITAKMPQWLPLVWTHTAMYGNLADAMKSATVLFPPPQIVQTVVDKLAV